ncbi:uncharacterized protein LOC111271521 isoform X1 [Varroa jacobsoni]|uniref:Uncharacterized protein n=1 Tax=Varroa destructor TaxID=109461 RepID=A0A7M7M4B6_VARDE|nr:uncharacterized protein LOC111244719 isoform X1 [Varroa destructor]XP_022708106.1 uncharacterized protein LOC111271521 isoform X1 [Varroa jacobsoni]XP_022708107.1 uncharacterized protein LOC111271521 isoform X1 [Varroa jacobsoni]
MCAPLVFVAVAVKVLALAAGAMDEEGVIQWFLDLGTSLGISQDGTTKLIEVLRKYEPDNKTKLPTVEELDEMVSKLKPDIMQAVMCDDDLAKVETMITKLHEAASIYLKSQQG